MRALVVEDCQRTSRSIENVLMCDGIACDTVSVAENGIELVKLTKYDVVVVDLALKGPTNGTDVILRLRSAKINVPIMIISGLSSVDHKIRGLGFGADDYMTKPFNRGEMIARIQAIIRRAKGHCESVIRFGPEGLGRINIDSRTVYVEGYGNVNLTSKEYSVLELLALRKGCVIAKETFLNHLYGGYEEPHVKIVDVFCCKCRKKLNEAFRVAKKNILKRWRKILDSGTPEEIVKFKKGRTDREIMECIERFENCGEESCSSGIATLWGRGYVLREFNEKHGYGKDDNHFSNFDKMENNNYWKNNDLSGQSDQMGNFFSKDGNRSSNPNAAGDEDNTDKPLYDYNKDSQKKYVYDDMNIGGDEDEDEK